MGATFTVFSLMLGLYPYHLLVYFFGGEFVHRWLVLVTLLSYTAALGLILGSYWTLTRGIKIIYQARSVDLPSERLNKIKISCALLVNLLYFLFLYILFPASLDMYP